MARTTKRKPVKTKPTKAKAKRSAAAKRAVPARRRPKVGQYVHIELWSQDAAATRDFFAKVFGWKMQAVPQFDYTLFKAPDYPHGGISQQDPQQPRPATLAYINTDDLDATARKVEDAGGKLLVRRLEVPGQGLFAIFEAPGGIVQALWQQTGPPG